MNFNNDAVFKREIVSSNWHWFVVAASLISGAFLRFHYIRRESLWLDEIDAITTSGLPIWQIPSALVWHASPPLDYFILHFFITRVGHSETLVR